MHLSQRLSAAPGYFLMDLIRRKQRLMAEGRDIIDLSLGDPDLPTPEFIIEQMRHELGRPENHRYPAAVEGSLGFRQAMAEFYESRFAVTIDPAAEVCALIGSKEGIAHLIWTVIDPGDIVLIPDPSYPIYEAQTRISGGEPYSMPLVAENKFLPDFDRIPGEILRRAKLMFLNYPGNPTAAVADLAFFARAVDFCRRNQIVLVHDNAYSELTFDDYVAPSILQVPGAKDVAVELWSFSKPFNMAGWRLACLVGNSTVAGGLARMKSNVDNGIWLAVQKVGAHALRNPEPWLSELRRVYTGRRDVYVRGMRALGLECPLPQGSFYVWQPVPPSYTTADWCEHLLMAAGVLVCPGNGYGVSGEGYMRISLTLPEDRLAEVVERVKQIL